MKLPVAVRFDLPDIQPGANIRMLILHEIAPVECRTLLCQAPHIVHREDLGAGGIQRIPRDTVRIQLVGNIIRRGAQKLRVFHRAAVRIGILIEMRLPAAVQFKGVVHPAVLIAVRADKGIKVAPCKAVPLLHQKMQPVHCKLFADFRQLAAFFECGNLSNGFQFPDLHLIAEEGLFTLSRHGQTDTVYTGIRFRLHHCCFNCQQTVLTVADATDFRQTAAVFNLEPQDIAALCLVHCVIQPALLLGCLAGTIQILLCLLIPCQPFLAGLNMQIVVVCIACYAHHKGERFTFRDRIERFP